MSRDLFELIHSLNKEEKRNFRLISLQVEGKLGNSYSHLYDIINKLTSYNEALIYNKFTANFSDKIYSYTKHYLKKKIIESLVSKQRGDQGSHAYSIEFIMDSANILFAKGQVDMAIKELEKVEKLAISMEAWDILINLYSLQLNSYKKYFLYTEKGINYKLLSNKLEQIKSLEDILVERLRLENLYGKFSCVAREIVNFESDNNISIDALNIKFPESKYHQFLYHSIHLKVHAINLNYIEAMNHALWAIGLFSSDALLANFYAKYLALCLEGLTFACQLKLRDNALFIIEKIESLTEFLISNRVILANNLAITKYEVISKIVYYNSIGNHQKVFEQANNFNLIIENKFVDIDFSELSEYVQMQALAAYYLGQYDHCSNYLEYLIKEFLATDVFQKRTFVKVCVLYLVSLYQENNLGKLSLFLPILKKKLVKQEGKYLLLNRIIRMMEKVYNGRPDSVNLKLELQYYRNNFSLFLDLVYLEIIEGWLYSIPNTNNKLSYGDSRQDNS